MGVIIAVIDVIFFQGWIYGLIVDEVALFPILGVVVIDVHGVGAGIVPLADQIEDRVPGDEGGVTDGIHPHRGDFREGEEVHEFLGLFLVEGARFGHHPAVEPDVASGFGDAVIDGDPFAVIAFVVAAFHRIDRVSAPGQIDADEAFDDVVFAGVDFEAEDVGFEFHEGLFDFFDLRLVAAVEDRGELMGVGVGVGPV